MRSDLLFAHTPRLLNLTTHPPSPVNRFPSFLFVFLVHSQHRHSGVLINKLTDSCVCALSVSASLCLSLSLSVCLSLCVKFSVIIPQTTLHNCSSVTSPTTLTPRITSTYQSQGLAFYKYHILRWSVPLELPASNHKILYFSSLFQA